MQKSFSFNFFAGGAEGRERGDMCRVGMAGEWVRMRARGDIKLAERSEPERALYCVLCELEHKNTVLPIGEYGE